ncbi:MAG: glycosyltransferase family 39 protein, partial [Rhodospirillaceae bacterium]|nr:glycosyltransferase family 39 protein [Rhodospirillaceae bacterium]
LVCAGAWSVSLGADANWDLHNYHLYNAYALLHGRYEWDIAPAGFQTFFHPLADLPFYLLVTELPEQPQLIAFAMGLPHGISALLLFLIGRRLFPPTVAGRTAAVAAVLAIGLTGAAILTTVGGTMNDYQIAPFLLAGVLWAMIGLSGEAIRRPGRWHAAAGVAVGLGVGLKLTLAPYGAALAFALLVAGRPWRETGRALAAYLAGAAVAFALVAGPWMVFLHTHFGSPLFPQLNDLFRSPFAAAENFRDARWFPRHAAEWAFFPFYWAFESVRRISEWDMRDPRLAAAYVAALASAGALLWRRRREGRGGNAPALVAQWRFVGAFLAAGFAAWMLFFSYLRYLAPIELLSGLPITGALFLILRHSRWASAVTLAAAAAILLATIHPPWERVAFRARYLTLEAPPVPPRSLVLVAGKPIGYVIPFMARDARFVAVANEMMHIGDTHLLARRATALIARHDGPLYLIEFVKHAPGNDAILAHYGLVRGEAPCLPIKDAVEHGHARLCPLRRIAPLR